MWYGVNQHGTPPLGERVVLATTDVDEARYRVSRTFCPHELEPRRGKFNARHHHAAGQSVSLNYIDYGSEVTINPGKLERFYLVQLPLTGRAEIRNGAHTVRSDQRCASVLNPTRETSMTWYAGCRQVLLQVDRSALHEAAELLTGGPLEEAVVFSSALDLRDPSARPFTAALGTALRMAEIGDAFGVHACASIQKQVEAELISRLLHFQPNSVSHLLQDDRGKRLIGKYVRRARDFMLGNLSEDISLADIAREVGISGRRLEQAFRAEYDCTPMEFLLRARLAKAHYLLQSSPPEARVSDIAFAAGFSHPGRFSIAYKAQFGRSPRCTLRGDE